MDIKSQKEKENALHDEELAMKLLSELLFPAILSASAEVALFPAKDFPELEEITVALSGDFAKVKTSSLSKVDKPSRMVAHVLDNMLPVDKIGNSFGFSFTVDENGGVPGDVLSHPVFDFIGKELKKLTWVPGSKILICDELHVGADFTGSKAGHRMLKEMEDVSSANYSYLVCYPLGFNARLKAARRGLKRLQGYYEAVGYRAFSSLESEGRDFPVMVKALR